MDTSSTVFQMGNPLPMHMTVYPVSTSLYGEVLGRKILHLFACWSRMDL